ncbi:MAG: VIT domain-containing protein [Candidatus Krumholzibacteriia bacterium]
MMTTIHHVRRRIHRAITLVPLIPLLLLAAPARATDAGLPGGGELELQWSGGSLAVPAVRTDVDLVVTGPLLRAVVRQEFRNPAAEAATARYVFPLPAGAAVMAMELLVGERRIVSVVKEKAEARAVFEQARREGRQAALVSSVRRDVFVTEVANVGPGETVTVRLEYQDVADFTDGWFSLVYPLTFTPRYFPTVASDAAVDTVATPADEVLRSAPFVAPGDPSFPRATIAVHLEPGLALADVVCTSHAVLADRDGDTWLVTPVAGSVPADRDFRLRWRPVQSPLARPLLFREDGPDGVYALLMVVPGDLAPAVPRPATDTVFVLDRSGSMGGPSIAQARDALVTAIGEQGPDDRFTVLAFDNQVEVWSGRLEAAGPAARQSARSWVRRIDARGGTELHPALLRARLLCGDAPAPGRARQIVLLTDAAVGNEDQLLRETVAALGDVRLHVVGIGAAPNRHLVRRLAGEGGGLPLFIADHEGDQVRLAAYLARIGRPQWADPRLVWQGAPEVEGYPGRLPSPVPGQLVLWSGRFPAGIELDGELHAQVAGQAVSLALGAVTAVPGAGLATRWAQLRVDDLMAAREAGGDQAALRQAIVATGLAHGLVTAYTSRVAVETERTADGPAPVRNVASGLPAGSQLMGALPAGGTLADLWRAAGAILLVAGAGLLSLRRKEWT